LSLKWVPVRPDRGNYVGMTERGGTAIGERTSVTIRPYRSADHGPCRRLWAELTEQHNELYDTHSGGADPGAEFEEYLARLDLTGMWVADHAEEGVVGLVGLILNGRAGIVEPVIVAAPHRGQGIGRALLGHVANQARGRGMTALTVSPESRNEAAIRCLHAAGYDTLTAVELTLDLSNRGPQRRDGLEFQGLRFSC
jgi:GNAT superfamily N-acetyltransferase